MDQVVRGQGRNVADSMSWWCLACEDKACTASVSHD